MRKIVLVLASVFYLFNGTIVYAYDSNINQTSFARADIIEWRYKSINGVLYKRLFNYSTKEWIGNWILA